MGAKQARRSTRTPAPRPKGKRPEAGKSRKKSAVGRTNVSRPASSPAPANAVPPGRGGAGRERDRRGAARAQEPAGHTRGQFPAPLCREVMSENPMCCLPGDPVDVVARLMVTEDVGALPVVSDLQTTRLSGIVTDRDLTVKVVAEGRDPKGTIVEEVMTGEPVTCHARDDVQRALRLMAEHQVRRIPVVDDDGCLIGIIAQADIATRVAEPEKTAQVVGEISRSPTPARGERPADTQH